jgi:hypothetical protein
MKAVVDGVVHMKPMEREADDYGLAFLRRAKFEPQEAVTALKKIAGLGKAHSFLSSHPDPDKRAERLQAQLEGRASPIEEKLPNIISKVKAFFENNFPSLCRQLRKWLPWVTENTISDSNPYVRNNIC